MNEDKPVRNDNPAAALAALLPQPVPVECTGEVVRPFSLALYAALDSIHSPLLYGGATDVLALVPSLFIACRGVGVAFAPHLLERSMEWADALPPSALPALRDAVKTQISALMDVTPESKKKDGAGQTGG